MNKLLLIAIAIVALAGCNSKNTTNNADDKKTESKMYETFADFETTPVKSADGEDAADDPAVWIHPTDRMKSTIIGSNKKAGVVVYDLKGEQIYFYPTGKVNNVDVTYNFDLNGKMIDLVGGSNRTIQSIELHKVNKETGELSIIQKDTIDPAVDDVYGFCFYKNMETKKHYAFVNGKDGNVEQYEMIATEDNMIALEKVRSFKVKTQVEGMVADYEKHLLYVGEEGVGVWQYGANPEDGDKRKFIALSDSTNSNIQYDVEGISIYYGKNQNGYLLVSSQGNFTYAVFDRNSHNYLGSFKVVDKNIDGSEETDGLDVCNIAFGELYPYGMFIAQDGFNYDDETKMTQNFKIVKWGKIADLFPQPLQKDTTFNLRIFTK